ncbi:hypothetical protein NM688_g5009 [Phlebia brevispora]|uniref:Uncharacterized protein n=1 Tax=Phlebia brevispora TaxID=194682 RepID=A0ACC1T1K5_9APHY|nr:hypothetical protein NM688_g5009 [Phlebia brevispora]
MTDFVQALDPAKLVLVEAVLSFVTSAFAAPVYNLPLFLFGCYAQESAEAVQAAQTFTCLIGASVAYDILWMARNDQSWFIRMLTIIILLLKIPTVLAFAAALRQRGTQFSGLGFRGNDLQGATVWSMPGGFTSAGAREGYQSVDEPAEVQVAPPKHAAPAPPPAAQPAPGAYQSV